MPIMVQVTGMVMETLSMLESSAEELEEIKNIPDTAVIANSPSGIARCLLFTESLSRVTFYTTIIT